ncbi:unnamed protein product [Lactuca virosa]|uniref:PGG domain-containing protein n=1 Tax=Lactuca virosa TaxID=75947 RepID=A0AAU9PFF0_9ASTR|nr:unnamed protein product [Lactuca virosa]
MASSCSNQYVREEVGEEYPYPYPSHVCAPNFVTFKLSGRDDYDLWKTQMLCLLKSHDMCGFIDGIFVSPQSSSSVSGKEKLGGDHNHWLWTRSDALVKGWILGSLSKQTLRHVLDRLSEKPHQERNVADFNAKDIWDELKTLYDLSVRPQLQSMNGPAVLPQEPDEGKQRDKRADDHKRLYKCILSGDWERVATFLNEEVVTVIDKITNNGSTALHVAVGTSKDLEFIQKMLERAPESTLLLDVLNSDGSTLLHVAAIVGNTEAAEMLLERSPDLLFAKDYEGHTPLAIALSNMHSQTSQLLLQHITSNREGNSMLSGRSGDELLVLVISSKDFDLAYHLARHYRTLHSDAVLMALAQNYPCEPNILEKYLGTEIIKWKIAGGLETAFDYMGPLRGFGVEKAIRLFIAGILMIFMLVVVIPWMLVWPFIKEKVRIHNEATRLLRRVCVLIHVSSDPNTEHHYYTNPLFEATRQNAYEIVGKIVSRFPNAIWSANKDGYNIIQYAVISRSEKVYNLLYQMSEHKNVYRTMRDSSGNNLLHLAARLAPTNKLNLISGAALQIQRELQWFKEVEGFVCPLNTTQKNSFDETPQMVFTREHKELVIEGEKWMKATAESYTISAALITTIVFAAAITVPGGNNQDKGTPIFTNNTAFTVFAISDAVSLFAAVTSLLMFLSILTARFAEQDFLFKLPTKLVIGLATLFISTTTMIIAFGATLYLVFGQNNSRILIPIVVLTCLPTTSFMTLQFPLIIELMSATYGRSIFGKKDPAYGYDEFGLIIDHRFY